MAYQHDPYGFPMEHTQQRQVYYTQPMPFQYMPQQHPHPDFVYNPYAYSDFVDLLPPGMMAEEYEDGNEITTRPRLTKEQVEILEAQFQAHPKPNGMVKRQLAMQTKLSLPRVANWFQNRRAKAKQQRKQEEFENSQHAQNLGKDEDAPAVEADDEDDGEEEEQYTAPSTAGTRSESVKSTTESNSSRIESPVSNDQDSAKEASWQSLQRVLGAARAGHHQHHTVTQRVKADVDASIAMPPPEIPRQVQHSQPPLRSPNPILPQTVDWSDRDSVFEDWASSTVPKASDMNFDFGFDQDLSSSHHSSLSDASPTDMTQEQFVLSGDDWNSSLTTPTQPVHPQTEFGRMVNSPSLPMSSYSSSRRGSAAEALAANFESFALAGSSPHQVPRLPPSAPLRRPEAEIDLAARRKRPRPAALTSASLRSRSYGQLTSISPTVRPGVTPPSAHTLRHVKSTGHALNSHYAGIRKASLATKSPLNMTTFAEAESFKRLMAQKATEAASNQRSMSVNQSSKQLGTDFSLQMANAQNADSIPDLISKYTNLQSPPITPFQQEFMMHHTSSGMSQAGHTQYATFQDYTPPYSAGPLTNSSWSDAPLTSPDLNAFPPVSYIPSLHYPHQPEDPTNLHQWMLPSDNSPEACGSNFSDSKKTEFYIQEFPNQREELAHVAQQLAQQRPKHYVFANTKASDYNE